MKYIKDLENIVNTVLKNRGKEPVNNLKFEHNLRDELGFDSLDLAELTVRIESKFNVDIFEDGLVNTIGEIVEKINKHVNQE